MRIFAILFLALSLCLGGIFFFRQDIKLSSPFKRDLNTLEIHFTPEELIAVHAKEILRSDCHVLLEPKLFFFPYIEYMVKYASEDGQTHEGRALWDLLDAELVLDTKCWAKSHGFQDCLQAHANSFEFALLRALSTHGGEMKKEELAHSLQVSSKQLQRWVNQCQKKQLVVVKEDEIRLHFDHPHLPLDPISQGEDPIVLLPAKQGTPLKPCYTSNQIKKFASTVFGEGFSIRQTRKVYLPVFRMSIQNPDGSILHTYWNGLTGEKERAP